MDLFPFALFSLLSLLCQCVGHVMRNFVDARRPHYGTRFTRDDGGAAHFYHARVSCEDRDRFAIMCSIDDRLGKIISTS